jgi:histidinol-phosphate aminotransferase
LVGAGADELIDLLMRLFLDPGDILINCPPTFGMYAFDADLAAATLIDVPRKPDFSLDLDRISLATEDVGAKLIFLAHPNNPDGGLIPEADLHQLLQLPAILVLDEAYIEFAPQGRSNMMKVLQAENLVVLRTFSKWAGLAGLRVGYGVFPDWMMDHLWKIKQPYNVSVAASAAAIAALEQWDELNTRRDRIIAERIRLEEACSSISFLESYPSSTNFILFKVIGRDARQLKEKLENSGILVRYFNKAGLENHIRISIGKPADTDVLIETLGEME